MSTCEQIPVPAASSPAPDGYQGVNDAGRAWLEAALNLEPCEGIVADHVAGIESAFGLSRQEAYVALLAALTLAVGSGLYAANPNGVILPTSLQFLWKAERNTNFDRAVTYLCQSVLNRCAMLVVPAPFEDKARLEIGLIDTGNKLAAVMNKLAGMEVGQEVERESADPINLSNGQPSERFGSSPFQDEPRATGASADLIKQQAELGHNLLCLKRKIGLAPLGGPLNRQTITLLVKENTDLAYGSFSPTGAAITELMDLPKDSRRSVLQFLDAGWSGAAVSGWALYQVYPVVSLVWAINIADSLKALALCEAVRGALVIEAGLPPPGGTPKRLVPLTTEFQQSWCSTVQKILEEMRLPIYRRFGKGAFPGFCPVSPDGAELIADAASCSSRFCSPGSRAAEILGRAPEQILKIATLLNLSRELHRNKVLDRGVISNASELFRWLAGSTISSTSPPARPQPGDLTLRIVTKLQLAEGGLTMRELARRFHNQDYSALKAALNHGIAAGIIECADKKYRIADK